MFLLLLLPVVAYDVYLHGRAHNLLNVWGYRGPVLDDKKPDERRVAVLGGSTAYGYGVAAHESIAAFLESYLRATAPPGTSVSVANLGYMSEGAYAFVPALEDFDFLDYDLVVLYEGYNDLRGNLEPNDWVLRRQSPIFRATGYFPVLPVMMREKGLILRHGSLEAAQGRSRAVFEPPLVNRVAATVLVNAAEASEQLGLAVQSTPLRGHTREFVEAVQALEAGTHAAVDECGFWSTFCGFMRAAIDRVLTQGKKVVVVSQPTLPEPAGRTLHVDQQRTLRTMLQRRYGHHRRVHHADLSDTVDLADGSLSFDQVHLTALGNRRVGDALAPAVRGLLYAEAR